jgi:hypothetical protein
VVFFVFHFIATQFQRFVYTTVLSAIISTTVSSSLKPLWKMNRNLVGSIYGMASIKIAHFAPILGQPVSEKKIF